MKETNKLVFETIGEELQIISCNKFKIYILVFVGKMVSCSNQ